MIAYFLFFIICVIVNYRELAKEFKKISKTAVLFLLFSLLLFSMINVFVVRHEFIIVDDESEQFDMARNMALYGKSCACDSMINGSCGSCSLRVPFPGKPFINSLMFIIFGVNEFTPFAISFFFGALSIIAVFFAVYIFTHDWVSASISAFLISILPIFLKISGSSALECVSLFFVVLGIACLGLFINRPSTKTFLLLISEIALTLSFRPENLLLPLIFSIFLILSGEKKVIICIKKNWKLAILLILLAVPFISRAIYGSIKDDGWNQSAHNLWSIFKDNIKNNESFFLNNKLHPVIYTLFAVIGLFLMRTYNADKKKFVLLNIMLALFFFLFFNFFIYGQFFEINCISSWRYALLSSVFISILAALPLAWIFKKIKIKWIIALILIVILISCFSFFWFLRYRHILQYLKEFIIENDDKIPRECVFLSPYISFVSPIYSLPSINRSFVTNESFLKAPMPECILSLASGKARPPIGWNYSEFLRGDEISYLGETWEKHISAFVIYNISENFK